MKKIVKIIGSKYSIATNSWTSGQLCIGAIDENPGDEILVPPWTIVTVMSILQWNAIPVFVDINQETFCIDENLIEEKISKKTKAIVCVDILASHQICHNNKDSKKI